MSDWYIGTVEDAKYLKMYGVLGMRWGVRKSDRVEKTPEQKRQEINTLKARKQVVDESSKALTRVRSKYIESVKKPPKRLDLSKLSNKELQDRIARENLERQYNSLFNHTSTITKGQKRVSDVMEAVSEGLLLTGSALSIAVAIKQLSS